jgi:hypothetical protein
MNIFYLHHEPIDCAAMHNDKHTIKMILEYAQLLSTAHRVLDGVPTIDRGGATGRQRTTYILPDNRDTVLYRATHINHPSAVWVRKGVQHYHWLYSLLVALCKEYTYRYGKVHKVEREGLMDALRVVPKNIPQDTYWSEPTPAMPDEVKVEGNSIASYRAYYINNKTHLASWRGKINSRNIPEWYNETPTV